LICLWGILILPLFYLQAERWRAKAVAKVTDIRPHSVNANALVSLFLNTFFCFFQVMESQGQLPLQGASSSGPLAGGADEEFVPLLQVMCGADF
jgi:hypothetical protein